MLHNYVRFIKAIPFLGSILVFMGRKILGAPQSVVFENSAKYWQDRYQSGGTSGAGAYGRLAAFKADTLNSFVDDNRIQNVVEYGCGDGAQLSLATYPSYTGFDVSPLAVAMCREKFAPQTEKYRFFHTSEVLDEEGYFDLAISLDVIYHLVEDDVFDAYMRRLFNSSKRFVIIYAYNFDKSYESKHERGREFLKWCKIYVKEWRLEMVVKNPYAFDPRDPDQTSQSDFFFFRKCAHGQRQI